MNIELRTHRSARHSLTQLSIVMLLFGSLVLVAPIGMHSVLAANEPVGMAKNAIGGFTVTRTDGIQEQLEGKGQLPLFEGDVLQTESASQAMIQFTNGIQVAMNENTHFRILSRWEKGKAYTRILRLKQGEVWVETGTGPKPLEVETPVATAAVKSTEFNLLVDTSGESTLTVMKGVVEFGTAFGTCPIRTSTISYGKRGKKCTKPKSTDVESSIAWTKAIRQ